MFKYTLFTDDVDNMLKRVEKNMPKAMKTIVDESNHRLTNLVQSNAPFETGALRASLRGELRRTPTGWRLVVFQDDTMTTRKKGKNAPWNYARSQEEGFLPHPVQPKDWMGVAPIKHRVMVMKSTPFMKPSLNQFQNELPPMLSRVLERIMR